MKKLWNKNSWELDPIIEAFETGDDLLWDQKLVKYDCWGTMAHGMGLEKIGIMSLKELMVLEEGLKEILALQDKGNFFLKHGDEDVHTKIENYLTEKYGETGKKVHTGRSRNDQVLTAIRLYTKDHLLVVGCELLELTKTFIEFAEKYEFVPMPGYTHMQKAMPSSLGMWASAFVESLMDDLISLKTSYALNDQSPLGSAAAYGVPMALDREYTAKFLGFGKVQANSLYCQNSRGKIEASVLSSLISILQTLNKFASDVLLFTTSEFNYFSVAKELCTGSSIMPQKRNIDIAELLRSKVHLVLGNQLSVVSLSSNLPSGYNRDMQDTKKPLFESLQTTLDCVKVAKILLMGITPNIEVLEGAMSDEIFATHKALALVKKGVSFRESYQEMQNAKWKMHNEGMDFENILKESDHVGGTGNLQIKSLKLKVKSEGKILGREKEKFESAIKNLFSDL